LDFKAVEKLMKNRKIPWSGICIIWLSSGKNISIESTAFILLRMLRNIIGED